MSRLQEFARYLLGTNRDAWIHAMIEITLNGRQQQLDATPDTPLLWALRETAGLTGTKFGCGIGACGACTVHIDGQAVRSCVTPVGSVAGRAITTIEGLSNAQDLHPVQEAWLAEQVPQCGYCQSGMIMAVAALLVSNPAPSDADIDAGISNICRCGTYERIRRAIHLAASNSAPKDVPKSGLGRVLGNGEPDHG